MRATLPLVDARVMVGRSIRHSIRNVEALLTSVILPIVIMLLFVTVFGGALETGSRYVDYVVPGIILLCAGFGSASTAMTVVTDLTNGIVKRFRTMPMSSSGSSSATSRPASLGTWWPPRLWSSSPSWSVGAPTQRCSSGWPAEQWF
ncbi:MAG TPA: ABC transporter permease [Acidimicrobiia bacterium]|nr:ABC transporter permease [Acidimicrobiia bacterium]